MEFKEKLLYARAKLNISQMDLASKLNVSFSTINRWESGKVSPTKKAEYAFEIFCKENGIVFDEDLKESNNG
ncbi:MAG: helix-turn-helix domain-containing protein [Acholeplasmatales bacterium]|nr:helix-turn-helix domain-containing protein [Acholeplasmatales bacterium]